jgi:hypothetical protein
MALARKNEMQLISLAQKIESLSQVVSMMHETSTKNTHLTHPHVNDSNLLRVQASTAEAPVKGATAFDTSLEPCSPRSRSASFYPSHLHTSHQNADEGGDLYFFSAEVRLHVASFELSNDGSITF